MKVNWFNFLKRKPKLEYPTVKQVRAYLDENYKGQSIGFCGNGCYHVGNGIHTGRKGWDNFNKKLLSAALEYGKQNNL